jgi:uncharacterized repeat protein (TIGR01451 family)
MSVDMSDEVIVTPGDVYDYVSGPLYYVTNEGNAYLNYTGSYYYTQEAGANNWTVEVWRFDGGVFVPLIPGVVSIEPTGLAEDAGTTNTTSTYYVVKVNPLVANSPDGSYIEVFTTFETTSTPAGTYEGANSLWYGGTSEARDYSKYLVEAPEIVMSRVSTSDAPAAYTGNDRDYVPGAVVTFTITYTNEGSGAAREVILIDKIPTLDGTSGTNLAHVNGSGNHGNVVLTSANGTATGWTVSYSTITNPAMTYGATADWSSIGTVTGNQYPSASGLYETGSSEYDAVWIKWEKSTVEAAEDGTVVWGVTIR